MAADGTRTLHLGRRRLLGGAAMAGLGLGAAGCAPGRLPAVPRGDAAKVNIVGVPNERFLIPQDLPALIQEFEAAHERRKRFLATQGAGRPVDGAMLAVSGGGEDGAFGAGLLCGWSAQGTRPVFDLVTGVSTGALTSPFAFVGSSADPQLRAVYTDIRPNDVLESRWLGAALVDDALADNAPLFRTIERYMDSAMLARIAQGYQEGRLLLVGSANLDAQIPVTWNIGAIAASGHPAAPGLIRKILLASAAIPGAFPPVMIDVTVDGKPFQEMHVDGGAFTQLFLYPRRFAELHRGERVLSSRAYIIRNARLDPNWASVDRRMLPIASRAISTMIASAGYNDVVRVWNTTRQDGVAFNLAFIGSEFEETYSEPFEQAYMRKLFDYAYGKARNGYPWAKNPP